MHANSILEMMLKIFFWIGHLKGKLVLKKL